MEMHMQKDRKCMATMFGFWMGFEVFFFFFFFRTGHLFFQSGSSEKNNRKRWAGAVKTARFDEKMDKSIDFTFPDIEKWTRIVFHGNNREKKTEKSQWQRAINTIDIEKTVTQKTSK
jgi:hypothetical protein